MLLQTFLQLNILILATPALAGWSLLPPVHAGTVHVVGIVWQYRVAEMPQTKAATQVVARQAKLPPAASSLPAPVSARPAFFAVDFPAALTTNPPFPYAARAP